MGISSSRLGEVENSLDHPLTFLYPLLLPAKVGFGLKFVAIHFDIYIYIHVYILMLISRIQEHLKQRTGLCKVVRVVLFAN